MEEEVVDFCYQCIKIVQPLDEEVAELLEEASRRAEANDRQTVMPQDL